MNRVALACAILLVGCSGRTEIGQTSPPLAIRKHAVRLGLKYPFRRVFLRAFKAEKTLELWSSNGDGPMALVRQYAIAAASGGPGPKRREGDFQVPEGVYRIDRFNPNSRYHLSMGLDYPNASDRLRSDRKRPGSDIFIHGDRVSIGCMAMTDPVIEEIYAICRSAGKYEIDPCPRLPLPDGRSSHARLSRALPTVRGLLVRAAASLRRFRDEPPCAESSHCGVGSVSSDSLRSSQGSDEA